MNASEVVISKGIDSRHIDVYHPEKWDALIKSLKSKASNNFNPRYRRLIREFAGNASRCKIDSQGRIMLTPHLMEMAGIRQGAKVSIVGIIDIIEIWDLDVYLQDLKDNPLTLD